MTRAEITQLLTDLGVEPSKSVVTALLTSFNEEKRNAIAETTNKLMDDIQDWKKPEEYQKLKADYDALKTKNEEFKDYEELKKFKADTLAQNEKQQKANYLKSIGCKHPDLFENQIDWSKASYDQEKKTYTGLDEVVKGLKESYKDMFELKDNPAPEKTIGTIDFGNVKTQNPEANKPLNLADAINDHYKK